MASSSKRWPRILAVSVAGFLFIGIPIITWLATVWTDYLWFVDLGHEEVFIVQIVSRVAVAVVFALLAFALLFVNARIARGMAPQAVLTSLGDMPQQWEEAILQIRSRIGPFLDRIILWGSILVAVLVGIGMSANWETFRIALAAVPFGAKDPQFGMDIGFFVFTLPALRIVADWLTGFLILTTIVTAVIHLVDGAIRPWERLRGFAPHVKAHLSVLLGLIVLSKAFDYVLSIYELNFSRRGQVTGASYADVHAQLPAYWILVAVAVACGIALIVNIRFQGWRLPIAALGIWIVAGILVGTVYPAIVQQFVVKPNEARLEQPYIERNIKYTRLAFGLSDVKAVAFPARENLTAKDIVEERTTLSNVRLWNPAIVQQAYSQLQSLRPYYDFRDVDVDRYTLNGQRRQVLISARELNTDKLADQAKTWVNEHLQYTHGFGVVMSPVNEADPRGMPNFIVRDIPPRTAVPELKVTQPRLYFGEDTTNYIIVDTGIREFDYPRADQNAYTVYSGKGGVKVGSLGRRVAWALRLGTAQILFSNYVKPASRVLIARDLTTRISRLAPWLVVDSDPYPAIINGRIVWFMDGYTASDHYPYSQQLSSGTNYVRNSVKITVDAYDGTTTFYAFDPSDPVLKAWSQVFPGLLTDAEKIPREISQHFRYPEGLFRTQAEVYRTYHMTDPRVFYNKEDSWDIPTDTTGQGEMAPFYVLMALPGQNSEDFQMIMPFTPRGKTNMIGWMSAKSDPADYGSRTVYRFPKERLVLGPQQVSAQINQDPTISPQLSLWNQRGSQAVFGDMLVIPIKDSIVYVQALYLQAEQTAIPELTRVIVVYADKVEMENTLEAALLKVFGQQAPASGETTGTTQPTADAATARKLFEDAIAAQRKGDWAEYGRLINQLGQVLDRLSSAEASATQ